MKNFIDKFIEFYKTVNITIKSLFIIGMLSLFETVITVFFEQDQTSPNDIAIRSVMSSIFGFIFGSQLSEKSNIKNRNIQIKIALTIALICLFTLILGHWFNVNQYGAATVEIRNLLFSAVGILLSSAKQSD